MIGFVKVMVRCREWKIPCSVSTDGFIRLAAYDIGDRAHDDSLPVVLVDRHRFMALWQPCRTLQKQQQDHWGSQRYFLDRPIKEWPDPKRSYFQLAIYNSDHIWDIPFLRQDSLLRPDDHPLGLTFSRHEDVAAALCHWQVPYFPVRADAETAVLLRHYCAWHDPQHLAKSMIDAVHAIERGQAEHRSDIIISQVALLTAASGLGPARLQGFLASTPEKMLRHLQQAQQDVSCHIARLVDNLQQISQQDDLRQQLKQQADDVQRASDIGKKLPDRLQDLQGKLAAVFKDPQKGMMCLLGNTLLGEDNKLPLKGYEQQISLAIPLIGKMQLHWQSPARKRALTLLAHPQEFADSLRQAGIIPRNAQDIKCMASLDRSWYQSHLTSLDQDSHRLTSQADQADKYLYQLRLRSMHQAVVLNSTVMTWWLDEQPIGLQHDAIQRQNIRKLIQQHCPAILPAPHRFAVSADGQDVHWRYDMKPETSFDQVTGWQDISFQRQEQIRKLTVGLFHQTQVVYPDPAVSFFQELKRRRQQGR